MSRKAKNDGPGNAFGKTVCCLVLGVDLAELDCSIVD
jgi:hypothetical protein